MYVQRFVEFIFLWKTWNNICEYKYILKLIAFSACE